MPSATWYLNRLRQMPAREVAYRLRNAVYTRLQQRGFLTVPEPPQPVLCDVAAWIRAVPDIEADHYVEAADRVLQGRAPIFDLAQGAANDKPRWNVDPATGRAAPMEFGKLVDMHEDLKYLCEPNRHLELVTVAQAYALTGTEKYLQGVKSMLTSWFQQCPYLMGPNWASSLELGIRVINWSIVWQLIGRTGSPLLQGRAGETFMQQWLASIYQHVHFIHNYYSRFSSANNHLIGEAAAVYIAGCSWPFWKELRKWQEEARGTLIRECEQQNFSDGVNKEQAVAYQQFVLDFLLLAGLAAGSEQSPFPKAYWGTINKMIYFLAAIRDAGGNVPRIGDDDDGRVVRLSQEPDFDPYRSLLATAAVYFRDPALAAMAGRLDDKTRWLVGAAGWDELVEQSADGSAPMSSFPEGGYYILGNDVRGDREIKLIMDAGPLGYLGMAAHGHADALAIVLSLGGREFLIDPGTFVYNGNERWRSYFRGTSAHNTLTIDDADQSIQGGPFLWLRHAHARCTAFQTDPSGGMVTAEHDGYTRLPDPVRHSRCVHLRGETIAVTDTLACRGPHVVQRCWHFSDHCQVEVRGTSVYAEAGGIRMRMIPDDPDVEVSSLRGSDDPIGGWMSRQFYVKTPTTSVYFRNAITGDTVLSCRIECFIE